MKTSIFVKLFMVMATAALVSGCATTVEPPFEWDPMFSFASPGTSLELHELGRFRSGGETNVRYELRSTGFSNEEVLSLWWKTGLSYRKYSPSLTNDGLVRLYQSDRVAPSLRITGYVLGEPVDFALVSETTSKRAHAKTIPFPIEAHGTGGCSVSVEMVSDSGHLFFVTFGGFEPGEEVQMTSQYKSETLTDTGKASELGQIGFPLLFGRGDRGTATITATGKNCTVSLQYKVGKDALVPQ